MKVPVSWLRQYCDPGLSARQIAERLSMTGTEVERVTRFGAPSADGFVLGHVLGAEPHPDADRLSVCTVDDGSGSERTIVCGAPNVAAGQVVPVALPGAVLADGTKLARAKLRGVVSDGMILSERELALGDDHQGIAVLGEAAAAGEGLAAGRALAELAAISDEVLELEITPNRPDCLSVYGIARELHAITEAPLAPPPWELDSEPGPEAGDVAEVASVTVEAPELCPRFTARAFEQVAVGPSPLAIKARLAAAGQRPISNVVDVTNYVMLETGQPLHAFDLDLVPGGDVVVRRAREGEVMRTLDGVERRLDPRIVVVADAERPSGIAGIMGGEVSEVSGQTTRVLLEAATWDGGNILETSGRLSLRSEASTRFEKQLHPELAVRAQRVASRMLAETAGASLRSGTIDVAVEAPAAQVISLHGTHVSGLLGIEIEADVQAAYLERLGFGVARAAEGELSVTVPADRHFDVTREVDLIEEVARVHDLDQNLPSTLPATRARVGGLSTAQRLRRRAEDALRDQGLDEIVAWSFVSPELPELLRLGEDDPLARGMRLHNPLSADQSVMRTTLIGGLLDAARLNLSRGADRVALYESGRVYLPERAPEGAEAPLSGVFRGVVSAPVLEPHRLGALIVGPLGPSTWRSLEEPADYFVAKGVVDQLARALGVSVETRPFGQGHPPPFLHPGRAASVHAGEREAGWVAELHPLVAREWDLPAAAAFEIDLGALIEPAAELVETYEDLISFPAVYQDLACVVDRELAASTLLESVREAAGELLAEVSVFDVYEGEQVGEGRRSVALRLEFRAADRTLTDEEAGEARSAIESAVESLGGSLRG